MKYVLVLFLLSVTCLVALGQDAVVEAAEAQPLWIVLLPAIVAAIVAILERMGKKDALKKLDGAIEVGRVVFAAVEESKATDVKKLVKEVMTGDTATEAGKEINNLLHSVTDVEAAAEAPPIKRFWRRFLAGKNLAGVAARVAAQGAVTDYLEDQ